jgi:endonuclease/exonuclease/phosphatase family metal-dependent hydrolase
MRRLLSLVSIIAFSGGCGWFRLEPRAPNPGLFHFTIATYNLNNDDGANPRTLEAIALADADIVCLQEITELWRTSIESHYAASYPYRLFRIDEGGGAAGLGILSRFPVRDGGWHAGPNGWHPAWHYLVDTPNGTFKILNTHLRMATGQHGNAVQSYLRAPADHDFEIRLFLSQNTDDVPALVVGDFNEGPNGSAVRHLESIGFRNALPLYHPGEPTWRYRRWIIGQFTQELDHILFDRSFVPVDAWVVRAGGSDHLPVVARLEVPRRSELAAVGAVIGRPIKR